MLTGRIFILLLFTFISQTLLSQRLITGRVLDLSSKSIIDQVDVLIYKGTSTTKTTENGYFQLTVEEEDSLLFMHPEYKIGLIAVPTADVFIVYMEKVDDYPVYLEGQANLQRYLWNNLKYAPSAWMRRIEGVLLVQLIINEDGLIEDCLTLNDFNAKCEKNALEVFKSIPGSWSPSHEAKSFIFPLVYKLDNDLESIKWPLVDLPEAKIMEKIIVEGE